MRIFLVSQKEVTGWNTYSDFVCIANDAESARIIHPSSIRSKNILHIESAWEIVENVYFTKLDVFESDYYINYQTGSWPDTPDNILVIDLGPASPNFTREQVICASFHAG